MFTPLTSNLCCSLMIKVWGLVPSTLPPPPLTSCPLLKLTLTFAEGLVSISLAGSRHFRIQNMNWLTKSVFHKRGNTWVSYLANTQQSNMFNCLNSGVTFRTYSAFILMRTYSWQVWSSVCNVLSWFVPSPLPSSRAFPSAPWLSIEIGEN